MHTDSDVMGTVVQSLCERIDTPRSLSVWLCFKYNQEALLELPLPDIATTDSSRFQLDYFITEYLSKYKGLKLRVKPAEVALEKWKLSESQCADTNVRIRSWKHRPLTGRVEAALYSAQRKIASVLGNLNLSVVLDGCKWGPGATFDLKKNAASPDKKMTQPISVTSSALPYFRAVLESDPHWIACLTGEIPVGACCLTSSCFNIVRGSRFLTVAKNAKTDRCIAAEPTGNSFLQQGVHSYIKRRLRRFGIDLDDQSINQKRAQSAYSEGLSTLDLSAASDTISRELVFSLLPLDWAFFLDALRSHETRVKGEWIRTEKFASMGNAFCFELETLIFWAVCSSAVEVSGSVGQVTVYGDDIIVPRESYEPVVEILQVCGFTVNTKKSYRDGYFFESCGKHFHRGKEVTPVYQKEVLNHPSELIRAHNRLWRFGTRLLSGDRSVVLKAARVVNQAYPHRPFPRIPEGLQEDGGFLRPLSDFSLDPNRGIKCHVLDFVPRYTGAREDALYAYKLRRFERLNPEQSGRASLTTQGTWRTKVRWVPEIEIYGSGKLDHRVLLGLRSTT